MRRVGNVLVVVGVMTATVAILLFLSAFHYRDRELGELLAAAGEAVLATGLISATWLFSFGIGGIVSGVMMVVTALVFVISPHTDPLKALILAGAAALAAGFVVTGLLIMPFEI
jgi:hypothetical protein